MQQSGAGMSRWPSGQAVADSIAREIKAATCRWLIDDETDILDKLSESLDRIELCLATGEVNEIRGSLHAWREFFHRWQNTLFHQEANFNRIKDQFGDGLSLARIDTKAFEVLISKSGILKTRLNTVYQSAMATMQIVESERSIKEAELASKLSMLAFIFVPVTLVTGVFGMDLPVNYLPISKSAHQYQHS